MCKRIAAILSCMMLVLAPAPGASAKEQNVKAYKSSFTRTKTWHSPALKRWFKLELTGQIETRSWTTGSGRSTLFYFGRPKVTNPTLKVWVYKNKAMTKKARLKKVEVRQYYYDRSCKARPTLSGSVSSSKGLSIGGSVTISCKTFRTAYRQSTYGAASTYTQNTTGASARWAGKYVKWSQPPGTTRSTKTVCVTPEFEFQPYVSSSADDLLKSQFSDICMRY